MKKEWKTPAIEILDVAMTMKGWKPPTKPEEPGLNPENPLDS